MTTRITDALKGTGGGYELTRILGAAGGAMFIISAPAFVAWQLHKTGEFDIVSYCLAFPGGVGAILAAVAGGAAWKDKGVASAQVTMETGKVPAKPPAGPQIDEGEVQHDRR